MPEPKTSNIIGSDVFAEAAAERQTATAIAAVHAELTRPRMPVPEAELDLLSKAALGDTGQSRTCRYLLCLLAGADDPTGFKGAGLLEMRTLDRNLADAYLRVLDWWRGPTKSDESLYAVLRRIEEAFASTGAQ